jgi:glutathione S-transferase
MEPILLYGIPAGSSMGLVAALEWLGKPYALCRVDMLGEMRDAAYARLNARHETPVLITDTGQPLTETMAISGWLEARDTDRKVSFEPGAPETDRMHQLMAFVNTGFTAAFGPLWTVMEMQQPDAPYQAALRRYGLAAVIERHDKLEALVGEGPYLLGPRSTLADAVLLGVARRLELHDVADPARWPHLLGLRRRLHGDPAVQFALAIENGERPAGSGACRGHVELQQVIERYGMAAA